MSRRAPVARAAVEATWRSIADDAATTRLLSVLLPHSTYTLRFRDDVRKVWHSSHVFVSISRDPHLRVYPVQPRQFNNLHDCSRSAEMAAQSCVLALEMPCITANSSASWRVSASSAPTASKTGQGVMCGHAQERLSIGGAKWFASESLDMDTGVRIWSATSWRPLPLVSLPCPTCDRTGSTWFSVAIPE
jgi:hypothetical protein